MTSAARRPEVAMSVQSLADVSQIARTLASKVLAPNAEGNDREGRFPTEAVDALSQSGLLGLTVPVGYGGLGLGPSAFAEVTALLAEQCPSTAMIYVMHIS